MKFVNFSLFSRQVRLVGTLQYPHRNKVQEHFFNSLFLSCRNKRVSAVLLYILLRHLLMVLALKAAYIRFPRYERVGFIQAHCSLRRHEPWPHQLFLPIVAGSLPWTMELNTKLAIIIMVASHTCMWWCLPGFQHQGAALLEESLPHNLVHPAWVENESSNWGQKPSWIRLSVADICVICYMYQFDKKKMQTLAVKVSYFTFFTRSLNS